jgi:hypothetical protein
VYKPEPEEEYENEELTAFDEEVDVKDMEYGKVPEFVKTRPIRKDESLKKRAE